MIVGCNNVKRLEHFYGSHGTFYDSPGEFASALSQEMRNVHESFNARASNVYACYCVCVSFVLRCVVRPKNINKYSCTTDDRLPPDVKMNVLHWSIFYKI